MSMFRAAFDVRAAMRVSALLFAMVFPFSAGAEPVTLKVSFWSSDRSPAYLGLVKPFVEAINREGGGLLHAVVYFSGALGSVQSEQPRILLDGTADVALVVPGQNPERFVDSGVIELPGLFHDAREASLVYTRLVGSNALRGYEDFYVIAAVGTYPQSVHARKRVASLADLKGQRLRVNSAFEGVAIAKLGALPMVLAINEASNTIASGELNGLVVQPAQLFDVGAHRLVSNHYLLPVSSAPQALLMNRRVFDSLPERGKDIVRKYSGEWAANRYVEVADAFNEQAIDRLKAEPRRQVTVPTAADRAVAQRAFDAVVEEWAVLSPHNRELLSKVRSEVERLRSAN